MSEIYETLISTPRADLKCIKDELNRQIPKALHTILVNKETSEDVKERKGDTDMPSNGRTWERRPASHIQKESSCM